MITHNQPLFNDAEVEAVQRVLKSGWVAQGQEVEAFEREFCEFLELEAGHAVAVSNGTSALFLALWSQDAAKKRIAFPVYTCTAIKHAVSMIKGIGVPIDVKASTVNIDVDLMMQAKPDLAIIPHMFGIPVDFSQCVSFPVIEDCAQTLGARLNGTSVGCFGDVSIFSFYATKMITSGGQGGMVVSKNKALIDHIRDYRAFDYRDDHRERFNFQMTDLQAAIGRVQLKKLPFFIEYRQSIFEQYQSHGMGLFDKPILDDSMPVRYRAVMKTKNQRPLLEKLRQLGINAIIPIQDWELLDQSKSLFPCANDLTQSTISLPIYPKLSPKNVSAIIQAVMS